MFARTFPYFLPLKRIIPAVHLAVYRATNGRLSSRLAGQPMLLLTTKGRHTGRRRVVPLLYVPDGEDMIVIGSNWGGRRNPDWYWNVRADPHARVQAGRRKTKVTAHIVTPEERPRVWSLVVAQYDRYENYKARTKGIREIPLVVLRPSSKEPVASSR